MLISFLILLIGELIFYGLILLFSRKISRPICNISVGAFTIILLKVLFSTMQWKGSWNVVTVLTFCADIIFTGALLFGYWYLLSRITYDFSDKIYSFTYFFNKYIAKPKAGNENSDFIIGSVLPYNNYQLKYNGKYITMNDISAAGVTLISGSSGSGKTYGMMSLIKQNISSGKSVIFAEYKGDPDVTNELSNYAKEHNFQVFNLSLGRGDFYYDPLKNLNNIGRIEALMNMRKWDISGSDAHYKTSTQLLLQKLVGEFSHKYDPNRDVSYLLSFYGYVKRYSPARDEWDSYSTVSKLIELLLTSSLKNIFEFGTKKNGYYFYNVDGNQNINQTLDFKKIKNEKFLLIVSFVSSNKELATSFSSLLFRDLLDECTVAAPERNILLCCDETGTLENPFIVKDIIEKGRSCKISTILAFQDINQVVIQTNEAYLNSILGTVNTFIVYNGATRNTAEKFAGVQLLEIEPVLMNLRKPINGKSPTAIFISKYPTLNKRTNSEVFRFEPYIFKGSNMGGNNNNNNDDNNTDSYNNVDSHNGSNNNSKNISNITIGENGSISNNDDNRNISNNSNNYSNSNGCDDVGNYGNDGSNIPDNEKGKTIDEIIAIREKQDRLKINVNKKDENSHDGNSSDNNNCSNDKNNQKNVDYGDTFDDSMFDDLI